MWNMEGSSTKNLLRLCLGYFIFYVLTGLSVKYFIDPSLGGMKGFEFLVYSTFGGNIVALAIVFIFRWYRFESNHKVKFLGMNVPLEFFYIIPSGICTAVVIPTTTIMYSLPISVMVAMVIMRGSVIVISRIVDIILQLQGLLKKKVYWQENVGVVFALAAVSTKIFEGGTGGGFDFLHNKIATYTFFSYIIAYAVRIYIMNYFKNSRGKGVKQDNKGFYAVEQFSAVFVILLVFIILFKSPSLFGITVSADSFKQIFEIRKSIVEPLSNWPWALVAGGAFGAVSFFSVFIFMYKGRTATFAGLVNRLTSLVAGTASTILFAIFYGGKYPRFSDWLSLAFIVTAIVFISQAEIRRVQELKAQNLIKSDND